MNDGEVVNKTQVAKLVLHGCYGTEELKLDSY
jgi:hypothetical protein